MLLDDSSFELIEKKTQKRREVKINANFQKHIKECYIKLCIKDPNEKCFLNPRGQVYTVQHINVLFKQIKTKYGLKIRNFSTHCCRKTMGRHVYENASSNGELALAMLSELFNHSSITITKRYLGIRKEEIMQCYDLLEF
jgi:site-specific recombinase XerD